jgi:hypothetical protein
MLETRRSSNEQKRPHQGNAPRLALADDLVPTPLHSSRGMLYRFYPLQGVGDPLMVTPIDQYL